MLTSLIIAALVALAMAPGMTALPTTPVASDSVSVSGGVTAETPAGTVSASTSDEITSSGPPG